TDAAQGLCRANAGPRLGRLRRAEPPRRRQWRAIGHTEPGDDTVLLKAFDPAICRFGDGFHCGSTKGVQPACSARRRPMSRSTATVTTSEMRISTTESAAIWGSVAYSR